MSQSADDLPRLLSDIAAELPPYATTEDILSHPRFALARNHYMRVMIDSYKADTALRHLMHEMGRNVLFNIILGQDALKNPDDPSTWPSVGSLRDVFMPFGLSSPRSFDDTLARMQIIGLIEIIPAPDDRRRRLVVPTEKMIREDLIWLADHMSPLAVLFPERDDYLPALSHDREHQCAQRIISTQNYGEAYEILTPTDPILALLLRQDAMKILFSYMLAAQDTGGSRASLPYQDVANRTSTSRTHVRNLLYDLEKMDMVKLHQRGGRDVEITPALWSIIDYFLAKSMSGHDLVWQVARQIVAADAMAA
ncbi:hypothetical protein [Devosia sp. FJ2-5-3]|uniref:hypothetical protein n=1 Tax=Devosia sp. FJ2-5-3 TaxID=2976680 RepID=UPI0023D89493|nr:hypothetical protein [Devosia sp. FJ2-5-3]WEJ58111.1 hypothetical protein N0P34_18280 [Devosia sp. FJ2-5-3]